MRYGMDNDSIWWSVMADSSPQFGRDWFILQYDIINGEKFNDMFDVMLAWQCTDHADFDTNFADALSAWESGVMNHIAVPTGIGSRRATLAHKLHNLLHSLALELGSWKQVRRFCEKTIAVVTDHGVESLLAATPTCILSNEFLPDVCVDDECPDPANCFFDTSDDDGGIDVVRIFLRHYGCRGPCACFMASQARSPEH